MMLTQNHLSILPITATFIKNTASRLASLSLHSVITLISTTVLLLILYILIEA
jgi:hypothetical protein